VNSDAVDTTDETAATLAMPVAHIKKGQPAHPTPPLAPRLDSATASLGSTGTAPVTAPTGPGHERGFAARPPAQQTLLGPGGTQPVRVGRALEHLPSTRSADDSSDDSAGGNLRAHPAGYYIPPSVAASLARPDDPSRASQPHDDPSRPSQAAPPPQPAQDSARAHLSSSSSLPAPAVVAAATQDSADPSSGPQAAGRPSAPLVRMPSHQPATSDAARRAAEPALVPVQPKSPIPLVAVLVGFLLVGFVVVALVMRYIR
jgi:hypothetical protein